MEWTCKYYPNGFGVNQNDYNWTELHQKGKDSEIYFYVDSIKHTKQMCVIYIPTITVQGIYKKCGIDLQTFKDELRNLSPYRVRELSGLKIKINGVHETLEIAEKIKRKIDEWTKEKVA